MCRESNPYKVITPPFPKKGTNFPSMPSENFSSFIFFSSKKIKGRRRVSPRGRGPCNFYKAPKTEEKGKLRLEKGTFPLELPIGN